MEKKYLQNFVSIIINKFNFLLFKKKQFYNHLLFHFRDNFCQHNFFNKKLIFFYSSCIILFIKKLFAKTKNFYSDETIKKILIFVSKKISLFCYIFFFLFILFYLFLIDLFAFFICSRII